MSLRKEIHDLISARLTAQAVYEVVDMWKAQITPTKDNLVQGYPAAFISIGAINWQDMTLGVKECAVTIDVYLFFNKYGDTFDGATDREDSFAIIDTVEASAEAIHWLTDNDIMEITQTGETDLTERYGRPAFKLTFTTTAYKQINPKVHVN